jgi:hypothetical protein
MRLRRDGLSTRELDGKLVILDLQQSQYLTLSETGTLLLRLLEQGRRSEELVEALVDGYDVDRDVAVRDVDSFVAQLVEAGLTE